MSLFTDSTVDDDWLFVTDAEPPYTYTVFLDAEIACDDSVRVDELTEALLTAPGVTLTDREDRDTLLVGGVVDPDDLAAWITDWWNEHR